MARNNNNTPKEQGLGFLLCSAPFYEAFTIRYCGYLSRSFTLFHHSPVSKGSVYKSRHGLLHLPGTEQRALWGAEQICGLALFNWFPQANPSGGRERN